MEHLAALDVSIKETSVYVIDSAGRVVREVKVPTESDAILAILMDEAFSTEDWPWGGTIISQCAA
jgi:transposase